MTAREAVNAVRARAGMPGFAVGMTKDAFEKKYRNERRIELAFEEHRFYDVRRWKIANVTENKPAQGITVTKTGDTFTYATKVALEGRAFTDKMYWLPIPRSEIQASNNKIQQNAGY